MQDSLVFFPEYRVIAVCLTSKKINDGLKVGNQTYEVPLVLCTGLKKLNDINNVYEE